MSGTTNMQTFRWFHKIFSIFRENVWDAWTNCRPTGDTSVGDTVHGIGKKGVSPSQACACGDSECAGRHQSCAQCNITYTRSWLLTPVNPRNIRWDSSMHPSEASGPRSWLWIKSDVHEGTSETQNFGLYLEYRGSDTFSFVGWPSTFRFLDINILRNLLNYSYHE